MLSKRIHIILTCAILSLSTMTLAQTSNKVSTNDKGHIKALVWQNLDNKDVLKAFHQRFEQLDSLITLSSNYTNNTLNYSTYARQSAADSLYEAKTRNEQKAFKRKTGLEITGQIYQRLDNTLGFDDDDQYSQYSTKFQGELGWNFFNSSFYQRKSELQLISLDNKLKNLQLVKSRGSLYWTNITETIEHKYDYMIATVLYQQLQNIDILNQAYQFLLEKDRVANDKLFDVVNEKMRIEYELSRLCSPDSVSHARLILLRPTTIEVDTIRLYASLEEGNTDMQVAKLREDMIDVKRKLTNYGQSMRLTPFLRASHYLSHHFSSSTNIDLGVRFTFPLYDDAAAKRKALNTEKQISALDRETLGTSIRQQCGQLIRQLDQLNRAISTEDYHTQQVIKMIELRKKAYKAATRAYNHVQRMEEYSEYLKSIERMYKLMRMRELCLVDINKATDCTDFAAMVNEKEINNTNKTR